MDTVFTVTASQPLKKLQHSAREQSLARLKTCRPTPGRVPGKQNQPHLNHAAFFALIQGHQSKASPIEFLSWSYGAASGLLIVVQPTLLYANVVVIFIYGDVAAEFDALTGCDIVAERTTDSLASRHVPTLSQWCAAVAPRKPGLAYGLVSSPLTCLRLRFLQPPPLHPSPTATDAVFS